jgi:hypothetical protein
MQGLPQPVLLIGDMCEVIAEAVVMLGTTSQRFVPGRFQPRPAHHDKPHPSATYKG